MTKKLILPLALAVLASAMPSCNSKSDEDEFTYDYSSSTIVTAFSLTANKYVLDSLQNVFFSIDLVNAQIFNADSLPYGTRINRLVPSITTASGASAVTLEFPREGKTDSIVNYLTNSTDSIDFSRGPVKLRVVSQSGTVERVYSIKVNVHTVKPDTLAWSSIESAPLPTSLASLTDQCTAMLDGTYYCLSAGADSYCLATTADPANPQWQVAEVEFPFVPVVASLRSTSSSLYMLSDDGTLYASTDFSSWTSCGEQWHYIYGAYLDQILGSKQVGEEWFICSYPSGRSWQMPANFPVENTSLPAVYDSPMSFTSQLVMVGGKDASGALSNKAWAYDGNEWANITNRDLPRALECVTMVAYDLFNVPSSTWKPVQYPALVAFGGKNEVGVNRQVYYSTDWGMTWRLAPKLMQLPAELPAFYGASAFVHSSIMHVSRSQGAWTTIPVSPLPPQCAFVGWGANSRVTEAPTEWECPAIYLFGGYDADGQCLNTVWRGTILRYTFPPKY